MSAFILLTQAQSDGSWVTLLIMLALMMVFFYFFLVRPQRKRQQEHQALIESLRRGDEVITIGGIYGKIVKIEKDYITLQVNEEGTTMRVLKESISQKEKAA
jgi:preprotein translocase subunit YajC